MPERTYIHARELRVGDRFRLPSGVDVFEVRSRHSELGDSVSFWVWSEASKRTESLTLKKESTAIRVK